MAVYNYSRATDKTCAKAVGKSLPVSRKTSVEVCRAIKGMRVPRAKSYLADVIRKQHAVPMVRYFQEVGHQTGMAVGKFPIKAAAEILRVLEAAEQNAKTHGLNATALYVYHAASQRSHTVWHYGRHGRQAKRTHIEIILKESAVKPAKDAASEKKTGAPVKKATNAAKPAAKVSA